MTGWTNDKKWSDRFIDELIGIVRLHMPVKVIRTGDHTEDAMENSDLVVLRFDSLRVACRVRRPDYSGRYSGEFTIRAGRPSGTPTELAKIMEGWGNLFIYAFSDVSERRLATWHLIDLGKLRIALHRNPDLLSGKYRQKNKDGSSWFFAWPFKDFPGDLVIARFDLSVQDAVLQ